MSWQDRLQGAAYTSPSGQRIPFDYEDVGHTVDKKTTGFTFPDADGTYVQDNGRTGRQFPLRVFFWGNDYDLAAAAFVEILLERGAGTLEHPIYGTHTVIPFGSITRRDDLKTAANQAVIEVTFWETIGVAYPTGQIDPGAAVLSAVQRYNDAVAQATADGLSTGTASERASLRSRYTSRLESARAALTRVADAQADVSRQFDSVYRSISLGIETLVGDPLTLAFQTTVLLDAPARARAAISDRLAAYRALADSIFSGRGASVNDLRVDDLYGSTAVTGSVVSVVNNQFSTKTEALSAATEILSQLDSATVWRDAEFARIGVVDTGEPYQQLQDAVALAAGFLVEISFSLKQERRIVLDRARTIVDLCAELYGTIDSQLDFLINSNQLTGSEILELPRGREIVYYT